VANLFWLSLHRVSGYRRTYVGLRNYDYLLRDDGFWEALRHNLTLMACVPVLAVASVALAALLYERPWGARVYQTLIFLPYVLAVPAVGVIAARFLELNGTVNTVLRAIGLDFAALDWLGSPRYALFTLMGAIVWKELGFGVVLMFTRMLSVPAELYEAATLDGAGWFERHRAISVPQIRDVILFYVIIEGITMLSWVFGYVYIISNGTGGPGTSTMVTELYIYRKAFGYGTGALGIAAAAAFALFLSCLALMVASALWGRKEE
jgi:ABC-type sugar transport system permease subunit